MIDIGDITFWRDEIRKSEKVRDKVVAQADKMIHEYVGEQARESGGRPTPINHYHEWLSLMMPQIVDDNPAVHAESRRSGVDPRVSDVMTHAVNWWASEVNICETLREVFLDASFGFGVVMVAYEPFPGYEGAFSDDEAVPYRPTAMRVSPRRWFVDHAADNKYEARYMGHVWKRDKEDLLNDSRFNADAIKAIAPDMGIERWHQGIQTKRKEIVGYEMWVPEHNLIDDPRAHGALLTLGVTLTEDGGENDGEARWIRDPRPYYGPAWGPYTMFGYHDIPDFPYPLSPFAAAYDQIAEANEHARAAAASAARHKRFLIADSSNKTAANTIKNAKDGSVVIVDGLKETPIKDVELGGTSQTQYEYNTFTRDRLDRTTGLDENARGAIDGSASATAVADAAAQRDVRTAMLKRRFRDSTRWVLKTAAWYLFEMEHSTFTLPQDIANEYVPRPKALPPEGAAEDIAMFESLPLVQVQEALRWNPRVIYGGGPSDEFMTEVIGSDGKPVYVVSPKLPGVRFEDMEFEIEPYSMERTDQALLQKRSMEIIELVLTLSQATNRTPNVEFLLDNVGKSMNIRNLADRAFLDPVEIAQEAAMMQEQMSAGAMPMAPVAGAGGGMAIANQQAAPATQNAMMIGQELSGVGRMVAN